MNDGQHSGLRVAIIGAGPRGLGAAEALAICCARQGVALTLDIYDPFPHPGAGPNFAPDQSEHCILNIPLRDIAIGGVSYPCVDARPDAAPEDGEYFPPFVDWATGEADDRDRFPPRAELGAYLTARFDALLAFAHEDVRIEHHGRRIDAVSAADDGWRLQGEGVDAGPYDEVVLSLGQPPVPDDDQISTWRAHADDVRASLTEAYPANALLDQAEAWAGETVAVRGLGLSTFDVIRLLTAGMGGAFSAGAYTPSGREPERIVPFSLNGHAPAPKPATADLDERFAVTEAETDAFEEALAEALKNADDPLGPICDSLIAPAARIIKSWRGADAGADAGTGIRVWLEQECDDPDGHERPDPVTALRADTEMATGVRAPDAGYVIGQIWRKLQNPLRRGFNRRGVAPDRAKTVLGFDEGLKRYSYGPPATAAEQLLILIAAGRVTLRAAEDPDIILTDTGWRLDDDDDVIDATVLIDAVLPPPDITKAQCGVLNGLRDDARVEPVADGLGAVTSPIGMLKSDSVKDEQTIGLLGRLALGSVIAADSIHDCFGPGAERWAEGVVERAQSRAR